MSDLHCTWVKPQSKLVEGLCREPVIASVKYKPEYRGRQHDHLCAFHCDRLMSVVDSRFTYEITVLELQERAS